MFKGYLKIAFRNLLKYKTYSIINIVGLAIGIASCMIIILFVKDELSFDKHNLKADQIVRIHTHGKLMGNETYMAVSPPPLGETLVRDFPEVIQYTRMLPNNNMLIRYKDNVFSEKRFLWADSTIFDVFTIPFVKGERKTALNQPHTVVLTETTAKKYFGSENPMDKIMSFEDGTPYTVRGVVKDFPVNSHFHFDILASIASMQLGSVPYWVSNNFYTYVVLKKGVPYEQLQAKMPAFARKYAGPQLYQALGLTYDEMEKKGDAYEFLVQPLTDIHLKSHLDYEMEPNSDIKYVYIFSVVAAFILLIACINFMNLATARSITRSREVGIRKVLGSNKSQLVRQFLAESVLLTFFAVVIAAGLVELTLPQFSLIADKELHTDYLNNWIAIPALLLTIIVVGLLAGSYPAFFLSSFQPVKVLKGKLSELKSSWLRSGLVVFQFSISIILFIGTFIVFGQLKFIQDKKLGFNKEHVLVIQRAWALEGHAQTFKDELLKNSNIKSASNTNDLPGQLFGQTVFRPEDAPFSQQHLLATISTDYDFARTMGLGIADGRYFSRDFPSDSAGMVLNESAAKTMNMKDPVGKRVILAGDSASAGRPFTVVGVVKDFHFESLHQKIRPLVIFLSTGQTRFLPIRINTSNIRQDISFIESQWKKFVPNKPFEYTFLDEDYNMLYRSEVKTGQIFTSFSILAILIACLGLFGLAAFTAERRTKEIGIRKVLGASAGRIVFLLSKEFTKWVLIANIIAWPVAYYFMNGWLENFAYRIDVNLLVFIASGVIALVIALLTVCIHALKAAWSNPVKSLRFE